MRKHDLVELTEEQLDLLKRLAVELDVFGWKDAPTRFDAAEVSQSLINLIATNEILSKPALGVVK